DLYLQTDNAEISVVPLHIVADDPDDVTKAQVKMLRLKSPTAGISGKLSAVWKDVKVELSVTTTAREVITPVNGLEFERDEYSVRLGATRHLRLFVDLEKIPLGSDISVTPEGSAVKLVRATVKSDESHLVTAGVALVEIAV